jgi:hypothetical protein
LRKVGYQHISSREENPWRHRLYCPEILTRIKTHARRWVSHVTTVQSLAHA